MRNLFRASFMALVCSGCVDPTGLTGFDCDDAGRCTTATGGGSTATGGGKATGGSGGGANTGGGAATGGGGATTGGGDGGGGGTPCNTSTCTGCCDATGTCRSGNQAAACGQGGFDCFTCASAERCQAAVCQPLSANGDVCTMGTECSSGACVSGLCCSSACTGSCETCTATGTEGRCVPQPEATMASACGAYACDGVSGSCPSTCTSSLQCASGRFCDNGRCELLRPQGFVCQSSSQCSSGFCADGVCCNQACSGSCDRCNLATTQGSCSPAPAGDPGSPACGGAVVCNGALSDCPILCTSGCPGTTFCSGTYCSAKRPNGISCGTSVECTSGQCVDGVCCNTACAGACDACSVAQGAATDGTCGLLGPSRICRAATNTCDVEERCDAQSPSCPANAFAGAGVGCGSTTYTGWSACDGGTACATAGAQARTRTEPVCNGAGACGNQSAAESQACVRVTEGIGCGTTTFSAYTACTWAASCSTTGSRTRTRTDPLCGAGTCSGVQNTETDTAGCARGTENLSCGSSTYGAYGVCAYGSQCAETGTRSRTRTDPVCQSAACGSTTATETDASGCPRPTTGQSCGTTTTGAWGTCSYGSTCATAGSRTRTVTTFSCGSGACNSAATTETDAPFCARTTTGQSCGTTQTGAWTTCSYANACSNTGSRTRSVTTYACNAGGGCDPTTVTETDVPGCARTQDGTSCGTTGYGAYGACSYANPTCSNSGSRSRSVTTYTCGSGACNTAGSTETDVPGCARTQDGTSCGTTVYGAWSTCGYGSTCSNSGSRTRSVATYSCGANSCNTANSTETDVGTCARNTNGDSCGSTSCGSCSVGCNCFCERTQICTTYTCANQACGSATGPQACGTCSGCNLCVKPADTTPER